MPAATFPMPAFLRVRLQAMHEATRALSKAANKIAVRREFTLDGRLVGDVGELLVAWYFPVELYERQKQSRDGTYTDTRGRKRNVEIKCRRASRQMDFTHVPDRLFIVKIAIDWSRWGVVYNGPGAVLRTITEAKTDRQGRLLGPDGRPKSYRVAVEDFRVPAARSRHAAGAIPRRKRPLPWPTR